MNKPLIIANWKMFGRQCDLTDLAEGIHALSKPALGQVDVSVAPASIYLAEVGRTLEHSEVTVTGQTASELQDDAARTGDISASMYADAGCSYVLAGHSERRLFHDETDEQIKAQVLAIQVAFLTPVLCVGESREVRDAGKSWEAVKAQLDAVLADRTVELESLVIAYEPVWAISGRKNSTADSADIAGGMLADIRDYLAQFDATIAGRLRLLYGGSVKPDNASAFFEQPHINGALVGGASLNAESFAGIVKAAAESVK